MQVGNLSPAAPAVTSQRPHVGAQEYPANPALDAWAGSATVPTVPKFFRMAVAKNPDGPYVGAKSGADYQYRTYKQVEQQVESFASALISAGIQAGDRVATFAENSPDWRVGDLGVAYAGAVHATLLAEYPDRTMEYVLKDSQSRVLVVDSKARLEQVLKSESRLPHLETIVVTGDVDLSAYKSGKHLVPLEEFLAVGAERLEANRPDLEKRITDMKSQDIGSIVYTSGSTGDPKGVLLSHGNILSAVEAALKRINHDDSTTLESARYDDLYASILPQGHVMGRVADYAMTAEGGAIAYPAGLIAFKKDLKDLKPTVLAATPLFLQKIYEAAEKKALRGTGPAVKPFKAGLMAGAGAAALVATGGAFIGAAAGGAAVAWVLGIAGGVLAGAAADAVVSRKAATFTEADGFKAAVSVSRKFYESRNSAGPVTRLGHWVAKKYVFPKVRTHIDADMGGRIRFMMSGGAPLGAEAETLLRGAGLHVAQGYGLSETCAGGLMNDPNDAQLGTAGSALPGVQVRLGEGNEIQISGPSVMSGGYLNKPDKTAESFTDDGWYRTGDTGKIVNVKPHSVLAAGGIGAALGIALGAVAAPFVALPMLAVCGAGAAISGLAAAGAAALRNGKGEDFFVINGRIKSQFKLPGGEYVTPEPIEEDLKGSSYISEAVVVGAKDTDMVGALIVPKFDNLKQWAQQHGIPTDPKAMVSHPDVIALIKSEAAARSANHARHEVVRAVAILDHEFSGDELTATMKLKRPTVLEHYGAEIDGMFK